MHESWMIPRFLYHPCLSLFDPSRGGKLGVEHLQGFLLRLFQLPLRDEHSQGRAEHSWLIPGIADRPYKGLELGILILQGFQHLFFASKAF